MNTLTASRVVRRAMLPVAIACALFFWWRYGTMRVPVGMDTMGGAFPPGALCLVDQHPSALRPGQVVFVAVDGQTLLSRIREVDADWFSVAHDNRASRWGNGRDLGRMPRSSVIGVVLTAFGSGTAAGGEERAPR